MKRFTYHAPTGLEEALTFLRELGDQGRVLAGGCDLLPELRRRGESPPHVVGIAQVAELTTLREDGETLRIPAMASLRAVERWPHLAARYAALSEGVRSIASVQVKATGTLVGNLCVATPASDIAPPLMVLGAHVTVQRLGGSRSLPVHDLFSGPKRSTLKPGELVTEAQVPACSAGEGSAFAKLTRTRADIAKVNAAVWIRLEGDACTDARIALGSVAPTPIRCPEAERLLLGEAPTPERIARAADAAAGAIHPITDLRSTATYRRESAAVLLRRVLARAAARARGGAQ